MYSITSLINLLDKPALKYWANRIGLNGIELKKYQKNVQNNGTLRHLQIENFIKDNIIFDGYDIFLDSIKGFEILGCEIDLNNDYIKGRADLLLKKNNKIYIVDLKSNKNIYISTKLQLSSYKHILNADFICVMNLDNFDLKILNINTIKYYEIIKRLYQIKKILDELNEQL